MHGCSELNKRPTSSRTPAMAFSPCNDRRLDGDLAGCGMGIPWKSVRTMRTVDSRSPDDRTQRGPSLASRFVICPAKKSLTNVEPGRVLSYICNARQRALRRSRCPFQRVEIEACGPGRRIVSPGGADGQAVRPRVGRVAQTGLEATELTTDSEQPLPTGLSQGVARIGQWLSTGLGWPFCGGRRTPAAGMRACRGSPG